MSALTNKENREAIQADWPDVAQALIELTDNNVSLSHEEVDRNLEAINALISGSGIEALKDNEFDNYYGDIGVLYVNTGDTYSPTICYDTRGDGWQVCSWGAIIEDDPERFEEF